MTTDFESSVLPPLFQLGYVPRDIESALGYWTRAMHVGPFFRLSNIPYEKVIFRGEETTVDCSLYIAYWGEIQIELVEQHCGSPSLYKEWLGRGGEGLHHVCHTVDDLEQARVDAIARGGRVEQELQFADGGGIYVDFGGGPGTILEILQAPPQSKPLFEMMRSAAIGWDGTNPLRPIGRQP